ncbi:MAG: 3-phenylpropionate/cinnamic acid dioxygenase subunit beta [Tuberibacillus sp.]
MDTAVLHSITQFLYQEAYFLDHRMYKEWFELLAEDIEYVIPMRVTVDNIMGSNIVDDMTLVDDRSKDIKLKVERLYTKSAWVDNPATRQRHFISNVMVEPGAEPDEYRVRSYFLYKRSRSSEIETEEMFGEREDIIRKSGDGWKIAGRTVYVDQSVLTVKNMAMFL